MGTLHMLVLLLALCLLKPCFAAESQDLNNEVKWPSIGISILVKNKSHSLPYALTCLAQQDYPKERIYFWFYVDKSTDISLEIIDIWANQYKNKYNKIYINTVSGTPQQSQSPELSSVGWTEERLRHLIKLRAKALKFAKEQWADYLFMLDADVFLTDPRTLERLVLKKMPIVSPMLISDGLYSNFWAGMTKDYYYERTENYEQISNRDVKGCFEVPMVHSAVLIDLRTKKSDLLTYEPDKVKGYDGPVDDIIVFAVSAKKNGIPMTVCNDIIYGFIPIPVDMSDKMLPTTEEDQFLNVKMEALGQGILFPLLPDMAQLVTYPPRDKLGVNEIFVINLQRRQNRRRLMEHGLKELGVEYTLFEGFDGNLLDMKNLSQLGVTLLPKYEDPFHKRPMKAGEVGCFLSHFNIWKEIAKRHIKVTLILEDDIHFTPFFRQKFSALLKDLDSLDWELVYIGRKVLQDAEEEWVTPRVTVPLYSYWTLGYLLSENGARKLLRAEPLAKMIPVDEFLPIMFDQHPNETWKSYFPRRDLKAFSAAPLLVHPTHYTGQDGYISDTEDSSILPVSTLASSFVTSVPTTADGEPHQSHYEF